MKQLVLAIFMFTTPGCCAVFGSGCPGTTCTTVATKRCRDNKVQVCNSEKKWDTFVDCDKLKGECGVSARDGKTLTCNLKKEEEK